MCGIIGVATAAGHTSSVSERQFERMRDLLAHRGPDAIGSRTVGNVRFGHRRLVVIDPSPEASQPFVSGADPATGEPRFSLVYNGELYNEPELRRELQTLGHRFRTASDTETVLRAIEQWGTEAIARLRGMFALAIHDARMDTLMLARDPLGVKPLYYAALGGEIMFASEIAPILRHPDAVVAPNLRMVSAYLTTIRTSLGGETLFQGVRSLPAGHMLQCDLSGGAGGGPTTRLVEYWRGPRTAHGMAHQDAVERVRACVRESITRQLRSDVPLCTLLSGGLDSTIIGGVASAAIDGLRTYAAGAPAPADCNESPQDTDLEHARRVARTLGTSHAEAHVTRELFNERWPWMVRRMGLPLSTPNEVAIYEVSSRLRRDGCIVTLSGEGADELFAGYDLSLDAAGRFRADRADGRTAAMFELESNAWTPPEYKPGVLSGRAWRAAEEDHWLHATYESEFTRAAAEAGRDDLEAHLRFQRRVNLTGLLQRLDSAAMLAGVEGRTPFADSIVADLAESIPLMLKYESPDSAGIEPSGGSTVVATLPRTKRVLREAFADVVPPAVLERSKASFPLPFQSWVPDHAAMLQGSAFARELFTDAAIAAVVGQPDRLWRLAWPMVNLAYWGRAMGW